MRSTRILAAAAAVVALFGCNSGQPRIYRVAVDESPLDALPATCYRDNSPPGTTPGSTRQTQQNVRTEYEWVIWDGVEGKQYLDLGNAQWQLGDAEKVQTGEFGGGVIEGTDDVFNGVITQITMDANNSTATRTKSIVVTFEDQSSTAKGTLAVTSKFDCTNCGDLMSKPGFRTCNQTMNFVGRRVDTQRVSIDK